MEINGRPRQLSCHFHNLISFNELPLSFDFNHFDCPQKPLIRDPKDILKCAQQSSQDPIPFYIKPTSKWLLLECVNCYRGERS